MIKDIMTYPEFGKCKSRVQQQVDEQVCSGVYERVDWRTHEQIQGYTFERLWRQFYWHIRRQIENETKQVK